VYCNAGHPPPFLIAPEAELSVQALVRTGMPLGISDDSVWEQAVVEMPVGGLLALYTDGVTDAQNQDGELFGEKQVLRSLQGQPGRSARQAQDALLSDLMGFMGDEAQVDDITLMVLVRQAGEKPRRGSHMPRTGARKGAI
jgi:serine phosphatase RsbU (regulator of sigma subunit)